MGSLGTISHTSRSAEGTQPVVAMASCPLSFLCSNAIAVWERRLCFTWPSSVQCWTIQPCTAAHRRRQALLLRTTPISAMPQNQVSFETETWCLQAVSRSGPKATWLRCLTLSCASC